MNTLSRICLRGLCPLTLAAWSIVFFGSPSWGAPVPVTAMARSGNEILALTVNGETLGRNRLQPGTVTSFAGATPAVVLSASGSSPATGAEALGYISDFLFDTGLINPAVDPGALTIAFSPPLVNRPGPDVVVLEIHGTSTPDPFLARINGNTMTVSSSSYGNTGVATVGATVRSTRNATNTADAVVSSISAFSAARLRASFPGIAQTVYGTALELTDFGVANGASVSSIQLGSSPGTNFDPVFVAGITSAGWSPALSAPIPAEFPKPPGIVDTPNQFWNDQEPAAEVPIVAEWNRSALPGESLTLTGTRFTEINTNKHETTVWVWANNSIFQADVWILEENLLTISLPDEVDPGVFLLWVQNAAGTSRPVAVNRPQAQWIGPLGDRGHPGQRKRVFGRSLKLEGKTPRVSLVPDQGTTLQDLNITAATPYSLEFELPTTLGTGSYQLWVHNGDGGSLGWSHPLPFTVRAAVPAGARVSVTPENAATLQQQIDRLSAMPNGGTVELATGIYSLANTLTLRRGVRLVGAGPGNTIIRGFPVFLNAPVDSGIQIRNLTIEQGLRSNSQVVPTNIRRDLVHDVWIENVELLSPSKLRLNGTRVAVINSRIPVIDGIGIDSWFSGNTVVGQNPATSHRWAYQAAVYSGNSLRSVVEKNFFRNEWPMDENNRPVTVVDDERNSIQSWYVRLFLAGSGKGGFDSCYLGENIGENIGGQINRDGNVGEMILLHSIDGTWFGSVASSSGTNVELSADPILDSEGTPLAFRQIASGGTVRTDPDHHLVILHGQGLGQARRIVANTESSVTVDRPWRVPPGPGSHVAIVPLYVDNIIYNNELNAFPVGYPLSYSKSQGISLFGNCWNTVVDGTVTRRSFNAEVIHGRSLSPSYWNEIRNGRGEDIYFSGAHIVTGLDPQPKLPGAATLGNLIRRGSYEITGPWLTGRGGPMLRSEIAQHYTYTPRSERPAHLGNVIEYMQAAGGKIGIGSGRHSRSLFRRNILTLADDPALNDIPLRRGISLELGSEDRFVENRIENAQEYAKPFHFMHYAIQDTAYRNIVEQAATSQNLKGRLSILNPVARIPRNLSSIRIPIANTGLATLTPQVASLPSWVSIAFEPRSLVPERRGTLVLTVDRSRMPQSSGSDASFSIEAAGQITTLGLTVDPELVVTATATPLQGHAPLSVTWTRLQPGEPRTVAPSYNWTFSDGGTASGGSVVRTYSEPGTYSATLAVTDNLGTINSTGFITVQPGSTSMGTPISWLIDRFGPAADYDVVEATDHDGDGQPTWLEYRAGTDPQDGSDMFRIVRTVMNSDGSVTLEWRGSSEHGVSTPFRVLGTSDLKATPWQVRAESVPRASSGNTTWTDPSTPSGDRFFYKIEAPRRP